MRPITVRSIQLAFTAIVMVCYTTIAGAQKCGTQEHLVSVQAQQKHGIFAIESAPQMQDSIISPSGKFKIFFDRTGANLTTDDYVQAVASYADKAALLEVDTLGNPKPPPSFSGDPTWHIYLIDKGSSGIYGRTVQSTLSPFAYSANNNLPLYQSYIEIDNDFPDSLFRTSGIDGARITVFHEFHHVIQFGIYGAPINDGNFREMTSSWLEMRSSPEIKDYLQYVPKYLQNIGDSFNRVDGEGYGQCIWMQYLAGKFGDSAVRKVWEWYSVRPTSTVASFLLAFDSVLVHNGSSFCSEYKGFGSELMTALMQGGSRLHQGKTTLPDLGLYPKDKLPIFQSDTSVAVQPASLAFFQATATNTYALVLSRNTDLREVALATVSFAADKFDVNLTFPSTFCDTTFNFQNVNVTVFPQPFINNGQDYVRLLASNRGYKPISSDLNIYNANNELVRHIEVLPEPFANGYFHLWDGRDDMGKLVTSGIYYYHIESAPDEFNGKIAVVRK